MRAPFHFQVLRWLLLFKTPHLYYMPDLTKVALARLSAVHKSLKVAKSGVKKKNKQALKICGRK
ncbi:hypothetical protein REPUB_Repub07fG0068600 [Reevesia pubescens]